MWTSVCLRRAACLLRVAAGRSFRHTPRRCFTMCSLNQQPLWSSQVKAFDPSPCYSAKHRSVLLNLYRAFKRDTKSTVDFPLGPVTVTDIKHYLRSKDIPFHDGYSCLHTPSIFCEPPPDGTVVPSRDSYSLFIDKTQASFCVWRLGWRGVGRTSRTVWR